MNDFVSPVASRLSLRPPQRESLEILSRVCELIPLDKNPDTDAALEAIRAAFPHITDFEREFPSLCFALATGVGKTRLMGAFVTYLFRAQDIRNFFVLAPNLTIYNKLIADFTPNTPKYVFRGIAEFAVDPPVIITGDTYKTLARSLFDRDDLCKINIFNISKINGEVRGGKAPKIKQLSEYIGQSYFDYLSNLNDLVLLMDESHRYRASAGVRAINELKPLLGLELTATPFVEGKVAVAFKNVIYDYPLARAMQDGFVKEPAVVTRKDFNPLGMKPEEIETLKLEDGIRLHESVKVELETYARQTNQHIVKPFVLVIARDTTHAGALLDLIKSDRFFQGRYATKVIQVDSSKTGAEEEEMISRLLQVEKADEPTEIVIHVNMLKEGWDVTNLYTIVPLRAANARILIEQSIGRGLRLPYGQRTGVAVVDTLNIIAHDKFQEIVEEANRPGSPIHLQKLVLNDAQFNDKSITVVSQSLLASSLGIGPDNLSPSTMVPGVAAAAVAPTFTTSAEQDAARTTFEIIRSLESQPQSVPNLAHLTSKSVQADLVQRVTEQLKPFQLELPGVAPQIDIAAIVKKTTEMVIRQTIDIPRILVVPVGEVRCGFKPFKVQVGLFQYQPPSEDLWLQTLRTNQREVLSLKSGGVEEDRPEDYIVAGLVDFDDVSYDDQADYLYELAGQLVTHLRSYLSEEDTARVLRTYQRPIADNLHAQMQNHHWEEAAAYETKISKGFTELKPAAFSASANNTIRDFRQPIEDKALITRYVFGGFEKCLYAVQKFDADSERKFAAILDRDTDKWFRPVAGQFQMYYQDGGTHSEYQPDFVAETNDAIYMIEIKASNQFHDSIVVAKAKAAKTWCDLAAGYASQTGGKPWVYVMIPHDVVGSNMTFEFLAKSHVWKNG